MSQENVDAFKRASEAANRQDIEALLAEVHPRWSGTRHDGCVARW